MLGVFGVPSARDDDSLRAVTAAVALRSSGLAGRVGLSTGEVVTGDPLVSGAPVDEAARLLERARAGDVLGAARTWRVVRHAVTAAPRDDGWAIDAVDPDAAPLVRRLETPLVGRDRELREIADAFERAAAEGRPHLVTVFGAPGVGKTRLAVEIAERLRELATAAVGRCRADCAGGDLRAAPRRADPLAGRRGRRGLDPASVWWRTTAPTSPSSWPRPSRSQPGTAHAEDTALATRRLLAGLARERPLLLVLEDVHWAAPAFLDLVESLVELAQAPLLVLCLARPDLLDVRPHWGGGRLQQLGDPPRRAAADRVGGSARSALLDRAARHRGASADPRRRRGQPALHRAAARRRARGRPGGAPRLDPDADRGSARPAGRARSRRRRGRCRLRHLVRRRGRRGARRGRRGGLPGDARPAGADSPWRGGRPRPRGLVVQTQPHSRRRLRERPEVASGGAAPAAGGTDAPSAAATVTPRRASTSSWRCAHGGRRERAARPSTSSRRGRRSISIARAWPRWSVRTWPPRRRCCGARSRCSPTRRRSGRSMLPKLGTALSWIGEPDAVRTLGEAHAVAVELGDARLAAHARVTALALMWADARVPPEQMLRELDDAVPVLEQAGDDEGLAMAEVVRFHARDRGRLPDPEGRLSVALDHARRAGAAQIEHHVLGWICITLPRGTVPGGRGDRTRRGDHRDVLLGIPPCVRARRTRPPASGEGRVRGGEGARRGGRPHARGARSAAGGDRAFDRDRGGRADGGRRRGCRACLPDRHRRRARDRRRQLLRPTSRGGSDSCSRGKDESTRPSGSRGSPRALPRPRSGSTSGSASSRRTWRRIGARRAVRGELVAEARELMAPAKESGMHADALLECAEALRRSGQRSEAAVLVAEAAGIAERLGYIVAHRRALEAQRDADRVGDRAPPPFETTRSGFVRRPSHAAAPARRTSRAARRSELRPAIRPEPTKARRRQRSRARTSESPRPSLVRAGTGP